LLGDVGGASGTGRVTFRLAPFLQSLAQAGPNFALRRVIARLGHLGVAQFGFLGGFLGSLALGVGFVPALLFLGPGIIGQDAPQLADHIAKLQRGLGIGGVDFRLLVAQRFGLG